MKCCSRILALVVLGISALLLAACNNQSPTTTLASSIPVRPSSIPSSTSVGFTVTPVALPSTPIVESSTAVPTRVATGGSVTIEVESDSVRQTIAPNQTAHVPADSGYIYVLAHFPYPIDRQTTRATVLPPSTMYWAVEMKNPPTADTLAFGLRGSGAGYMAIQIAGAQSIPPTRFGIQVGNGVPPPTPPSTPRTITLANDGQTIYLHVGDRFLLDLGEGFDWGVSVDNPAVLSRVVNVTVVRGAQGLYEVHLPGRATLTATGDPPCRQAQPPCGAPSIVFQIYFVVL